ncbi:hypothetical protein D3Z55_10330 [Clostridiaceae bacterium]|nr:hypothetical protein [Clostridiaceae bacterium]
MMSKSKIKRLLSVLCVLAMIGGGVWFSNKLMMNKASGEQYDQFFKAEQDFDVLFLGSSHMINGVSPLDLFREYGITSYNLSMHGNYVASSYYLFKESLEILNKKGRPFPKAVVLDIYGGKEIVFDLHNAWDSFPLSRTKAEMVANLVPKEDQAAMLVPFFLYHNRWNELKYDDFRMYPSRRYGVQPRYEVCYPADEIVTDSEDMVEADEEKLFYINQMNQLCKSLGIKLILIHIPYSYHPEQQREANAVCRYAQEQGIFCVNYMNQNIGLDFDIDFYDQGHLNASGMRILTREMGRLLIEAGMEDHRGQPEEQVWEEENQAFIQYRIQQLWGIGDVKGYLMGICDPDLIAQVQIRQAVMEDKQIGKLVERLRRSGCEICVTETYIEIPEEGGASQKYDIYCCVYRKDDPDMPIHTVGFSVN